KRKRTPAGPERKRILPHLRRETNWSWRVREPVFARFRAPDGATAAAAKKCELLLIRSGAPQRGRFGKGLGRCTECIAQLDLTEPTDSGNEIKKGHRRHPK